MPSRLRAVLFRVLFVSGRLVRKDVALETSLATSILYTKATLVVTEKVRPTVLNSHCIALYEDINN